MNKIQEIQICADLARQCGSKGNNEKSFEFAQRGLNLTLSLFNQDHAMAGVFYGLIGAYYTETDQYEKALQNLEKELKIFQSQKQLNYFPICTSKDCIARVYRLMKQYKKSQQLYLETIKLQREKLKGQQRQQLALTLVNFAGLCITQQRIQQAMNLYKEAIQVSIQVFGKNNNIQQVARKNIARLQMEERTIRESGLGVGLQIMLQRQKRSQTYQQQ